MEKEDVKKTQKLFVESVKAIAKELDKPESEITLAEFKHNDIHDITNWDLRKAGGFSNLKKLFFNPEKNIVIQHGSRLINSYRNKLDKQYGEQIFKQDEFLKTLKESLENTKIYIHKPIPKSKISKIKKTRTIIAHLSDTHFGSSIEADEMGGVNKFNWEIASRRTALFAQQIANYKQDYRKNTELVLLINGDIIAGMIHNQEWFADLLTVQFCGALSILSQMISYLSTKFHKIRVFFTSGNHGRSMHKSSQNRASTHKWDSYETQIYTAVQQVIEGKHSNVVFKLPDTPFNIVDVQGHKFFQTHGDTVINVGDPGKSLNMKDINNQINKLNVSELGGNEKFAALIVGHAHVPTIQLTDGGSMLIINGCLSGLDPFAQSIGVFNSNPTQQIFEVTKEHAVGDIRFIQLKSADTNNEFDKIIKPYEK